MKASFKFLFVALLFVGLISCREEEVLNYGVTIEGIPGDTTLLENSILTFDITVKADDGLKVFKMGDIGFPVSGLKTFSTKVEIRADSFFDPSTGKIKEVNYVNFFAQDKNGDVLEKQLQVRVKPNEKIEDNNTGTPSLSNPTTYFVKSDIASDQVWYTGKIYILEGRITVMPKATLTIQKGVIVKGKSEMEEISSLVISRGAMIDAQGTDSEPIIFTSDLDYIVPGKVDPKLSVTFFDDTWWDEGRNPNFGNQKGLWGGLVILGKARGSFMNDVQELQLPGIPDSDVSGRYGGTDNQDNSGILKNVYIRYAGNRWDSSQRLSALTLAGVGSRTRIENVEIYSSATDGIAIYGGNVDLHNILIKDISNYGVRIDQGWSGELNNFGVLNAANTSFDIQGPEGSYYNGNHSLVNGYIDAGLSKGLVSFREDSNTDFSKILINNITELEFGFNVISTRNNPEIPTRYNPKFEQNEVLDVTVYGWTDEVKYTKEKFDVLFKGWEVSQIKLVDWDKNSAGPYLYKFLSWSWLYNFLSENGYEFHGI